MSSIMESNLLPKVKSLIKVNSSFLVQDSQEKLQQLTKLIGDEIKAFFKDEQSTVSKDLAKKTKELFVLSSDNEYLKQNIEDLQNKVKRFTDKVAQKEKHIVKLMNDKQREKRQLEQMLTQINNQLKKEIHSLQMKVFQTETKFKAEISDLRKIHKEEIAKAIQREQQIAQNNQQKQRYEFAEEKKTLIQTQNKEKSQLIKKYQHKLQDLRDNQELEVFKLKKEHNQIQEKDRKIKSELNNNLFSAENSIKKLQGDLGRQTMSHEKYKSFSESLSSQLQQFHLQHNKTLNDLQTKLQSTLEVQTKNQRKLTNQINALKELLQTTIKQKDDLFQETINTMKNQHNDFLESTKSHLIEEKQIAINQSEMKHYTQIENLNGQFYTLQREHKRLSEAYKVVEKQYEDKIAKLIRDYQDKLQSVEKRNQYEVGLEGQTAKKTLQVLQRKYKLQIASLKRQSEQVKQELTKKINDQRVATTNKLTTQYETMINDIKVNNEVTLKQKLIEFDRKSKAYEKKLSQAEKRRVDLKILMDRQKLEMQMKIDSLSELVEKLQSEIEELHHHIVKMEKQKTSLSNEYEFKLLVKKNQLQQVKDQFEIKEHELRNLFNEHIRVKNFQIQRFSDKVTTQVQALVQKHNNRVELIEKEYNQLKKIMGERTSLPEDIQALKIFHKGYIKLEEELEKERSTKRNLQRQIQSKCAIQKVFVSKSFVPKIQNPNPIKVVTMKQFFKKDDKLIKFKSQNL